MTAFWPPPPTIHIAGRARSSFHILGSIGLVVCAVVLTLSGVRTGLSLAVLGMLFMLGCATFLTLAWVTRIIVGEERLIYYHHEIAILLVCSAALALMRLPVAAYLDTVAVAMGSFLCWGRMGCSAVGCCYGRPVEWGWRYDASHVRAGFPSSLRGVPLLPVQWFEAAGVFVITTSAAYLLWTGAPSGRPLGLYLGAYAVMRFAIEFHRGDPIHRRWGAWTEAQWTSIAVFAAVAWRVSPLLTGVVVAAAIAGGYLSGRFRPGRIDVRQLGTLATFLRLPPAAGPPLVHRAASGLNMSKGTLPPGCRLYVVSSDGAPLSRTEAARLLKLIACVEDLPLGSASVVQRDSGVTAFVFTADPIVTRHRHGHGEARRARLERTMRARPFRSTGNTVAETAAAPMHLKATSCGVPADLWMSMEHTERSCDMTGRHQNAEWIRQRPCR